MQLTSGDWVAAAATFERIVREWPAFTSAYIGLGEALEHQGRGAESVAAFRAALKAMPDSDHAILALGRTLLRFAEHIGGDPADHLRESIQHMNTYAGLNRRSWATAFNIGVAKHRCVVVSLCVVGVLLRCC